MSSPEFSRTARPRRKTIRPPFGKRSLQRVAPFISSFYTKDLPGVAANSLGGATFLESKPLDRDLNLVVGQSAPSGWMWAGRDYQLEQSIVGQLSYLLGR